MWKLRQRIWLLSSLVPVAAFVVIASLRSIDRGSSLDNGPDAKTLLEQVINHVVTSPGLESEREFYGTPGGKRVALLKESPVPWPEDWHPKVPGYTVEIRSGQTPTMDFLRDHVPGGSRLVGYARQIQPRLLAISLDKLNLQPDRQYDDQIVVGLFNIGGNGGQVSVIGGCTVYYTIVGQDGQWYPQYAGSFDP